MKNEEVTQEHLEYHENIMRKERKVLMGLERKKELEVNTSGKGVSKAKQMKYDLIRYIMEKAGGRFVALDFVKKDGTLRTINVQPAAARTKAKGDKNTKQMKEVVEKRKQNNPHLLNAWDVKVNAFRSINMDTVSRIKFMGDEIRWEV